MRAYGAPDYIIAEREARAIMADVEPCPRLEDWTMELSLACFPADSFMGECFKDALSTFVGQPCGCAQGIHWSTERGYFYCNGIVPEP